MAETISPEAQARHWAVERGLVLRLILGLFVLGTAAVAGLASGQVGGDPVIRTTVLCCVIAGAPLLALLLAVGHGLMQSRVDHDLDAADD